MTVNFSNSLIYRIVEICLLLTIIGLLVWSRPWTSNTSETRKITVTGEATIDSAPDEYVLSPYFQKSGKDKKAVQAELSEQANTAVIKLKELGISEDDIKLDASSYDYWYASDGQEGSLQVSLQISLTDKDQAQKAQDYLLTLNNIQGQLTPQATFSDAKSKDLETQATEKATEDAKNKADQQAKLVGAKVGNVITISDSPYNEIMPMAYAQDSMSSGAELKVSTLPVLSGKNEYKKTITITYELQ